MWPSWLDISKNNSDDQKIYSLIKKKSKWLFFVLSIETNSNILDRLGSTCQICYLGHETLITL
jgi:hypothetical protein